MQYILCQTRSLEVPSLSHHLHTKAERFLAIIYREFTMDTQLHLEDSGGRAYVHNLRVAKPIFQALGGQELFHLPPPLTYSQLGTH